MMKLIAVILVMIVGAFIAHVHGQDPGFVVVGFKGYAVRTNLLFFLLFTMGVLLLIQMLARALVAVLQSRKLYSSWSKRKRQERAQKSLHRGLALLAGGQHVKAEKLLSQSAPGSDVPMLHYLSAARAAHAQGSQERRNRYLRLADASLSDRDPTIGLARTEMEIEQDDREAALADIQRLKAVNPNHPQVIRLELNLARREEDWNTVLALLPPARRHHLMTAAELGDLQRYALLQLFDHVQPGDDGAAPEVDPHRVWQEVPQTLRSETEIVAAYAGALARTGSGSEAEALLRSAIKRRWRTKLVELYGDLPLGSDGLRFENARKWQRDHARDPELKLTIAKLAARTERWDTAKELFEEVLEERPDPEVYAMLAETLEALGDEAAAAKCCREGLFIAARRTGALVAA